MADIDIKNGVVQTSTGYLLRCGYCDFTVDGSFDPMNETQYADCPVETFLLNDPFDPTSPTITSWVDGAWSTLDRP